MPQIDIVTYFPIILWTLIIFSSGFILFNLYFFLRFTSIMKLPVQWKSYILSVYWISWNREEVFDWFAWVKFAAGKIRHVMSTHMNVKR